MKFYAQLNENNVCIGISQLNGEVNQSNMIEIPVLDTDYIWRKYENGAWSTEKYEPQTTSQLTEFEETKQRISDLESAIAAILGGGVV